MTNAERQSQLANSEHQNLVANTEHQDHAYKKDTQERQEGECYSYMLGVLIINLGIDDEERRKILIWLSPEDFEQTHEKHLKKRFAKTGQWLLDDPRFMSWRDEEQSGLLWCHGSRK